MKYSTILIWVERGLKCTIGTLLIILVAIIILGIAYFIWRMDE